jgi:hypothetical protein
MPTRSEAEENLRIIRSLMEKATIYRAISAPSALIGGTLALIVATVLVLRRPVPDPIAAALDGATSGSFIPTWLCVLAVTGIANLFFLHREALRRGDPFVSAGMRLAMRALLPSWLVAAAFTAFLSLEPAAILWLAWIWVCCHGIGLLATEHFAPRSITILGWAFLITALALIYTVFFDMRLLADPPLHANLIMGGTFGFFHLIYAACTWPRKSASVEPVAAP